MSVSLCKIASDIASENQEKRVLASLKILRLQPQWISRPSEIISLLDRLGRQTLEEKDAAFGLGVLAYAYFMKFLAAHGAHDESTRQSCLSLLQTQSDATPCVIKALVELRPHLRTQDLALCSQYLDHDNPQVRLAALGAFKGHGSDQDMPLIFGSLADPDSRVRFYACHILSAFGHAKILEVLATAMKSNAEPTRHRALLALAHIKTSEEVIRYLLQGIGERLPHLKIESIQAMGYHRNEKLKKALMSLQNDLSIEICEAASQALALHREGHDRVMVDFDHCPWPFRPLLEKE